MFPSPRFASQEEIDLQYNPSIGLADPAAPLRHYQDAAARARRTLPHQAGLAFGPTPAETLDIFPADRPDAPVFVFFHGGYWRALNASDFSGVALGPRARGITTVVVNYALCPEVTLDEIVRQARAALAWVLRHIGAYGGDPRRVAVGGHSAGAQLAAMCLQAEGAGADGLPRDPCRAALLASGLYELEPLRWSYLQPVLQLDEGLVERNSPLRQVRPCATSAWITWGGDETREFARQASDFHAVWSAAGNAALCSPQPGTDHFSVIHGLEDPASPLCDWLARQLDA